MKSVDDKLLTVREVAEMIGFSISTIYSGECCTDELIRIEFRKSGQKKGERPAVHFSYLNVQAWIAKHKAMAEAEQQRAAANPALSRDDINQARAQHQLKLVNK